MADGVDGDLGMNIVVVQQHVGHVDHTSIRNRNTIEPVLVQNPTLVKEDVLAVDLLNNTRISIAIRIFVKVLQV